jgi:hypothetical protein
MSRPSYNPQLARPTAPWKQEDGIRPAWRWVCVELVPQTFDGMSLRAADENERGRQWVGWSCSLRPASWPRGYVPADEGFPGYPIGRPARLDFSRYAAYRSLWVHRASEVSWGYCNPDRERYEKSPLAELRRQRGLARKLAQQLSQQNPRRWFAAMLEQLPQGDAPQTRDFDFEQMTAYKAGKRIA